MMNKRNTGLLLLLGILFSISFFSLQAQTIPDLIRQGDQLEKEMKETEAYGKFKEVLKQQPNHVYALIRCSELASRIGKHQTTEEKQLVYYETAYTYALRALRLQPNDSDANMVMALAYGRMALMKSGKEKVSNVRDIKSYAEKALHLNPRSFKAMHVLGKWHYEVSDLNMMERAGARLFFGGLPKASFDSSIYFYEKAKALSPGFILNYLELAKAYEKTGQTAKAISLIRYLLKLPNTTSEDVIIKTEATRLLRKWN